MGAASAIAAGIQIFLLLGIIGLLGYTIYMLLNRDKDDVLPASWFPEWYKNFVHKYPTNYSKSASSNVIPTGNVVNATFTAKKPADCVNKSKTGCDDDKDCVGFLYKVDPVSNINTCSTLSSVNNFIADPTVTSNTLYTVEGSEPTKYYATYFSNVADSYTAASLIPAYISVTDYFDCASNCSANTSCLGFQWNPTTRNCIQHTAIKSSNLVTNASMTSYVLSPALTLMNSSPVTFPSVST